MFVITHHTPDSNSPDKKKKEVEGQQENHVAKM